MLLSDFDYFLPEELIAQEPVINRDQSRLMVLHRQDELIEHRLFKDLLDYLLPTDILVINDTKVIPARLFGERAATGAKVEVLLLKQVRENCWEVLVKPGRKAQIGDQLIFGQGLLTGIIQDKTEFGGRTMEFQYQGNFMEILSRIGTMPLPPYIKKKLADQDRYQTVYARQAGSAAAPTAGLHFTPQLLEQIKAKGVKIVRVLLHVGLGTFRPVQVEDVTEHQMHSEYYEITPAAAALINQAKAAGQRVIAVGTTSTRCLESAATAPGLIQAGAGWTEIFIYPGYQFNIIDGLITNFHLPKSTLLMLISALAGREKILAAYQVAVARCYRFFSFGDAMLII